MCKQVHQASKRAPREQCKLRIWKISVLLRVVIFDNRPVSSGDTMTTVESSLHKKLTGVYGYTTCCMRDLTLGAYLNISSRATAVHETS